MTDASARALVLRAACLYVPVAVVALSAWWRHPRRLEVGAAIVSTAWALPSLLAVNKLAEAVGWWHFEPSRGHLAGMPVDLWIGWALLWGAAPVLVDRTGRRIVASVIALAILDLIAMPRLQPVVSLGPTWLIGESLAITGALVPAILLGRLTVRGAHLQVRAAMQVVAFAGLVFFVIPEVVFAAIGSDSRTWSPLLARARWELVLFAVLVAPAAAMALQAVREFALIGGGTPLPLDPPTRLVTSGPYAFVANPMQLAGTLLLLAWGVLLANALVVAAGLMAAVFSAGLAAFNEHRELGRRFDEAWTGYRSHVRLWLPRWRPATNFATIDIAATCDPCQDVAGFIADRAGPSLRHRAAESLAEPPRRITYTANGRSDRGVAAVGRALEHSHLGWALVGWTLRLPGIQQLAQLIADAVGAGPRDLRPSGAE